MQRRYRIVGFFPDLHTWIIALLSSWKMRNLLGPILASHISRQGRPIILRAKSAATISASGVECDTHLVVLIAWQSGRTWLVRERIGNFRSSSVSSERIRRSRHPRTSGVAHLRFRLPPIPCVSILVWSGCSTSSCATSCCTSGPISLCTPPSACML